MRSPDPSAFITPVWKRPPDCLVKAIMSPRGLHVGEVYTPPPREIARWPDPSDRITYKRALPDRSELNTVIDPSGLNEGEMSMPGSLVRRDSCRVRRFIT